MDIQQKTFVLIGISFYRESEKLILLMQRIIFGGQIFKKMCNLRFLGVCAKNCQTPGKSFLAELSKLPFLIPEEQCGFMIFLKKLSAHCFFLDFEWKTLQFHQTFFSRFVKTAFFRVQSNIFDEKSFFIEFIKLNSWSGYDLKFFGD